MAQGNAEKMGILELREFIKNRYIITEENNEWILRKITFIPEFKIESEMRFKTYEEAEEESLSKKQKFLVQIIFNRGLGKESTYTEITCNPENAQEKAASIVSDIFNELEKRKNWGKLINYQFKIVPC